jgi:peptidoglycan L-alanyl-D-glutamate endopeptidase CwlK
MISSRNLDDLHPHVKALAQKLISACEVRGIDLLVTSTYRDKEAQTTLWQKGRSIPGAIVTNARTGESFHNYRLALDFCPLEQGKCDWGDSSTFMKIGMLAETLGMEWAGRWTGAQREIAHVQWTGGLTLADLQNGKVPPMET